MRVNFGGKRALKCRGTPPKCVFQSGEKSAWHLLRLTQEGFGAVQVKMAELEVLPAGAARFAAGCSALLPLPQAAQEHE